MERIAAIDIGKGIAICFVVLSHVLQKSIYGNNVVFEYSTLENFLIAVQMPLFMFLSGLVAKNVDIDKIGLDITTRFRTIIIPFLFAGITYSLLMIPDNWNPFHFMISKWKAGYWYFLVLFYCYIINYILNMFPIKNVTYKQIVKLICALIIWKAIGHTASILPWNLADFFSLNMLWIVPYFFIGNAIKELKLTKIIGSNSCFFVISFLIAVFGSQLHMLHTLSLVLLFYGIAERIATTKTSNILAYLGKNSVYIYIFHFFVFKQMNFQFLSTWMCEHNGIVLDLIIGLPLTAVAIIFSLFMMRVLKYDTKLHSLIFGR